MIEWESQTMNRSNEIITISEAINNVYIRRKIKEDSY